MSGLVPALLRCPSAGPSAMGASAAMVPSQSIRNHDEYLKLSWSPAIALKLILFPQSFPSLEYLVSPPPIKFLSVQRFREKRAVALFARLLVCQRNLPLAHQAPRSFLKVQKFTSLTLRFKEVASYFRLVNLVIPVITQVCCILTLKVCYGRIDLIHRVQNSFVGA